MLYSSQAWLCSKTNAKCTVPVAKTPVFRRKPIIILLFETSRLARCIFVLLLASPPVLAPGHDRICGPLGELKPDKRIWAAPQIHYPRPSANVANATHIISRHDPPELWAYEQ